MRDTFFTFNHNYYNFRMCYCNKKFQYFFCNIRIYIDQHYFGKTVLGTLTKTKADISVLWLLGKSLKIISLYQSKPGWVKGTGKYCLMIWMTRYSGNQVVQSSVYTFYHVVLKKCFGEKMISRNTKVIIALSQNKGGKLLFHEQRFSHKRNAVNLTGLAPFFVLQSGTFYWCKWNIIFFCSTLLVEFLFSLLLVNNYSSVILFKNVNTNRI